MKPQPGDIVVKKHRSDCFQGTDLDLILRSNGIKTVVITGVVTQGCVESTARSAAFQDYFVVVPRDCVATSKPDLHAASLKVMEYRFDVVNSADVIRAWGVARALRAAGAWSDLNSDDMEEGLDRIRHESPPLPPIAL